MRRKLAVYVTATKPRELHVEDDDAWDELFDPLERVKTVFDGNYGVAGNCQRYSIQIAQFRVVFDDQHGRLGRCHEHAGSLTQSFHP